MVAPGFVTPSDDGTSVIESAMSVSAGRMRSSAALDLVRRDFREAQRAAREIEPREADARHHAATVVRGAEREQIDVAFVGEQGRVGQRARRDDAHDLALDRPLRCRRIADLLADRDRLAELHELREILLARVMRHARHPDRIAARCAALREREIEQARGFLGVVEEKLVEIAHAVENERAGMLRLDAQILLHHRRVLRQVRERRGGVGGSVGECRVIAHLACCESRNDQTAGRDVRRPPISR